MYEITRVELIERELERTKDRILDNNYNTGDREWRGRNKWPK